MDKHRTHQLVKSGYAQVAQRGSGCCGAPAEQSPHAKTAALLGYSEQDTTGVAADANLGLGCGNPSALAGLEPGETVVDLGSGAGFDALLCAEKLGPQGRFIGVDMTPEMLERARINAVNAGYARTVECREGLIEELPVASRSVDVVISNCVINLSTDKDSVLREAYRVLRPGGRFAVSDIVIQGVLPEELRRNLEAWAGCVAGALHEDEYRAKLAAAGFTDIDVEVTRAFEDEEMLQLAGDLGVPVEESWLEEGRICSAFVRARRPQ